MKAHKMQNHLDCTQKIFIFIDKGEFGLPWLNQLDNRKPIYGDSVNRFGLLEDRIVLLGMKFTHLKGTITDNFF